MGGGLVAVAAGLFVGIALVAAAVVAPLSRTWRWVLGVLGVLVLATPILVMGLFLGGQPEPLEPDDTLAIGVRVEDGEPQIWLGPGCDGVTELRAVLKREGSPANDILDLRADEPGVEVEQFGLTPQDYPSGMEADTALVPEQLELDQHHSLTIVAERAAGVGLEPVLAESDDRPGEYWFDEPHGWMDLDEAEQQAAHGELSTVCEPGPEQ